MSEETEAEAWTGWFVQTSLEEWLGGISLERHASGKVVGQWRLDVLRSERDRDSVWYNARCHGWCRSFRPAAYIRECREVDRLRGHGPSARAILAAI